MLKIRRPLGRLIFNMGIAIPGKTVFLIETAPSRHRDDCILVNHVFCIVYTCNNCGHLWYWMYFRSDSNIQKGRWNLVNLRHFDSYIIECQHCSNQWSAILRSSSLSIWQILTTDYLKICYISYLIIVKYIIGLIDFYSPYLCLNLACWHFCDFPIKGMKCYREIKSKYVCWCPSFLHHLVISKHDIDSGI